MRKYCSQTDLASQMKLTELSLIHCFRLAFAFVFLKGVSLLATLLCYRALHNVWYENKSLVSFVLLQHHKQPRDQPLVMFSSNILKIELNNTCIKCVCVAVLPLQFWLNMQVKLIVEVIMCQFLPITVADPGAEGATA